MVNYGKLADDARGIRDAGKRADSAHREMSTDPCIFFQKVKASVVEEMNKANVELQKRRASTLGRNHLPGFDDQIFLTYGTDALCRVGLGIKQGECHITAAISGPPNGYEISRKEYRCCQDPASLDVQLPGEPGYTKVPTTPNEIAEDIISSILVGKFN
jgi:hypothetical protein